jgi:hypothetical protein
MNACRKTLLIGAILLSMKCLLQAASREAQWKAVEEAISRGLPRTAITNLEPIITGALRDKAYGEAAKAIARRIVLEGNIQGNKPEEKITRMEAEIAKAPTQIVPLLQTILADWYWHYFQNNRWRFMQRTATAQAPGKDFTTWDLPRLFAEIDKQFSNALANADVLMKTPVAEFNDLLLKGTMPDSYRPTLYDFIAQEALMFYSSGEQAAARSEDAFELFADQPVYGVVPVFGSADEFIAGKIERRADESPVEKGFFLYRDLLRFHRSDKNPTAFANADLERLVWAYNTAFGEDKNARYKAALKAFTEKWTDSEVSALALHHWARLLQQDGNFVEARTLAQRGENAFRNSVGGKMCHNLIEEIEAKSFAVTTERVWNTPGALSEPQQRKRVDDASNPARAAAAHKAALPTIVVRYRNLTNLYFRAVAWDWNDFLDQRRGRPEYLNDPERAALLARNPALVWSTDLPPTPNFKERAIELPAPDTLKPGFYFLIASSKADFSSGDNQVTYADFWVSDLALVVRARNGDVEGFVLEANSGEPVPGAEVAAWYLDNNGNRVAVPAINTDENGFFAMGVREGRGYLIRVRHQGRELASQQEYWSYRAQPDRETRRQTVFFTDRALYRPGQTIQYKGIVLEVNQDKDNYEVLPARRITVVFVDPNGKEIAKAEHRCNDYGSFTGSFTAPRDRLMGRYRIYVTSGEHGDANFNVEEYKRPKFQVTIDAPKTAAKLNDKVSLTGKADAYTGAAIDGAKVKWRVVREVRWPYWWGWYWRPTPRVQASQEIAHGTATTEPNGIFQIEFFAKPDPAVSEKDEASFAFSIYADVTDTAGETRSAQRSINVGFTALQATLSADEWHTMDKPVELKIRTTTLDGEAQTAKGTVKIYKLKEPAQVQRAPLGGPGYWRGPAEADDTTPDLSNPNNWELGDVIAEKSFTTDAEGNAKLEFTFDAGVYRAMLETQDRFGKKVTGRLPIQVLNPGDTKFAIKIPHLLSGPKWSLEPGDDFTALWGTGYDAGRAFIEVEHRGKMIQRFWTGPGSTQQQVKQAVNESLRGGFFLHVTQVRDNRAYLDSHRIDVPWSNKDLDVKWEHFVSKLQPGQKETWTAVIQISNLKSEISNPERAIAEMVATLYDESLDQFMPLHWLTRFNCFRNDWSSFNSDFANMLKQLQHLKGQWASDFESVSITYRHFPPDLVANVWGYGFPRMNARFREPEGDTVALGAAVAESAAMPAAPPAEGIAQNGYFAKADAAGALAKGGSLGDKSKDARVESNAPSKRPDLSQVTARKNLNETAFFFPQLTSDSNGVVRMTFTMPEALTQWRLVGFAHDRQVRSGFLDGHAVTSKDLMVQPNAPRFVREGDTIEFAVKVSNQSTARQEGKVKLTFVSALTGESEDDVLKLHGVLPSGGAAKTSTTSPAKAGTTSGELAFDIPAKESRSYSWRIHVPDGAPFLTYKAVASTGRISDGEEGYLPVLSRRIFVTESLPLPIRGKEGGPVTKRFTFAKLLESGKSKTLVNENLVVHMVSNPSWYAVMALPYLMEYPYECTEQTFNRFYANSLARFIANSDPKIRRVFDQWKSTPALDSPLEKNQDLKAVLLEETPWLRQANNESQARKNVGILFDANRLDNEADRTLVKLTEMQLPDASWPWFPGGRGNDYITLYIATGFGRMRHLGVDVKVDAAIRALNRLDNWMREEYERIQTWSNPEEYVPSATDALYLYGRSFFLKDRVIAPPNRKAVDFFLAQSRKYWLKVNDRQSQGHLALALRRFNASAAVNDSTPKDIMRSIKERSVTNEELGMFWRETELSWWWYRAPIETQALMIEAFDEVMGDQQAVEECRVWLLKQKQTQDWKTTKATADAVYSLLLRGRDVLSSDTLVEVTLGGKLVTPPSPRREGQREGNRRADTTPQIEAGTGFYEVRFVGSDIKPAMGEITVKKLDPGVAWGSVHWQYLEDMSSVTPHEGTPLKLKKSLYTKINTKKGQALEQVNGPVQVGDELVVRIELRVDRDMEYVHLKDQRGSGTEPVNVLSQYHYQDGLAYYETTRDTASHFFIDYLPKGTYVFEYSTRAQLRGEYQTGVAEIQCMYSPEFNSHSEGLVLQVK